MDKERTPQEVSPPPAPLQTPMLRDPAPKIQGRLLIISFLLCVLIACGLGAYSLTQYQKIQVAQHGEELSRIAQQIGDLYQATLTARTTDLYWLSLLPQFQQAPFHTLRPLLYTYRHAKAHFEWIGIIDEEGRLLIQEGTSDLPSQWNVREEEWYKQILTHPDTHIQSGRLYPELTGPMGIIATYPIHRTDHTTWTLVGFSPFSQIWGPMADGPWLNTQPQFAFEWTLINEQGTILDDSLHDGIGTYNLLDHHSDGALAATQLPDNTGGWLTETHQRRQVPVITGYTRFHIQNYGDPANWILLIRMDVDDVIQITRPLMTRLGTIGILLLLPLTIFGLTMISRLFADIRTQANMERQLHELAHYDALTGLPNRRLFLYLLTQSISRMKRDATALALLFIDLDGFKLINDSLGHPVGDKLLIQVAQRLSNCVRASDTIARLGGDEFTVILENVVDGMSVAKLADKIKTSMTAPFILDGRAIYVTPSIGIALWPNDTEDRDTLIKHADVAMYAAKEQGNGYRFYISGMNMRSVERLDVETGLHQALEQKEFILHYQPLVNGQTKSILATEALIRWNHPTRGLLMPEAFIAIAETTGLIVPIGAWVLEQACWQLHHWHAQGHTHLRMMVNLSRRQFEQPEILEVLVDILQRTGVRPSSLELELTESLLVQDHATIIPILKGINELGVRLSLDDFGVGYSSLSHLSRFPITTLKVDRSFLQNVPYSQENASIVTTIIGLAKSLGLNIVAEGVETEAQAAFLTRQACPTMQGYYFSKPCTLAHIDALLLPQPSEAVNTSRPSPAA